MSESTRTMPYVVFWDTCAWVAATLNAYIVQQGPTTKEAIDSLRMALESYVTGDLCEGRPPWESIFQKGLSVPKDILRKAEMASGPLPELGLPDRTRSYVGSRDITAV